MLTDLALEYLAKGAEPAKPLPLKVQRKPNTMVDNVFRALARVVAASVVHVVRFLSCPAFPRLFIMLSFGRCLYGDIRRLDFDHCARPFYFPLHLRAVPR